jgi:hypothetical protein
MSTETVPGTAVEVVEEPDALEVRRDGALAGVIGLGAAGVAVAWLQRAVGTGALVDWLLCAGLGAVAVVHLVMALDARVPLVVADGHGVRLRRGRRWEGVAWRDLDHVEHRPRTSMLRDGRLTFVSDDRRSAVRLSLSTRLVGADWHQLTDALVELADGRTEVHELVSGEVEETPVEQVVLAEPGDSPTPERDLDAGRRVEARRDPAPVVAPVIVAPEPAEGEADEETVTMLIDDPALREGVADPVVGPPLAAARRRIGLSVDQLADRTRIRPHVIEAIEVDDFGPCGGDFYARGHLRTLARVLGVDVVPLLEAYNRKYADAPINPRTVFEAELATGTGSIRDTRGGLNWSVLVAVVMAVVLVWAVARLVMDAPVPLADRPVLDGSPGGQASLTGAKSKKVPVTFTAATGGARVIVRDGNQEVVFDETLPFMQTAEVDVVPPVRISSTDGGLVVTVDGDDRGALGETGADAQNVFVVRH